MKISTNLEYYIYFTICDYSMKYYKEYSQFSSYAGFCNHYKNMLYDDKHIDLMKKQSIIIIKTDNKLNKIFGLTPEQSVDYIIKYFDEEKYRDYEEIVMRTYELYKNCLN